MAFYLSDNGTSIYGNALINKGVTSTFLHLAFLIVMFTEIMRTSRTGIELDNRLSLPCLGLMFRDIVHHVKAFGLGRNPFGEFTSSIIFVRRIHIFHYAKPLWFEDWFFWEAWVSRTGPGVPVFAESTAVANKDFHGRYPLPDNQWPSSFENSRGFRYLDISVRASRKLEEKYRIPSRIIESSTLAFIFAIFS